MKKAYLGVNYQIVKNPTSWLVTPKSPLISQRINKLVIKLKKNLNLKISNSLWYQKYPKQFCILIQITLLRCKWFTQSWLPNSPRTCAFIIASDKNLSRSLPAKIFNCGESTSQQSTMHLIYLKKVPKTQIHPLENHTIIQWLKTWSNRKSFWTLFSRTRTWAYSFTIKRQTTGSL